MADLEAYQAYMLRGKGAPLKPLVAKSPEGGRSSGSKSKSDAAVLRAFQGRLQEWKDTDNQLEAVLGSITNLRDRIWWEIQQMETKKEQKPWEEYCLRPSLVSEMTLADVQMALTHDLLQHEKMMANGRKLIASLAQAQDGMGRRLDEWMIMNLEYPLSQQGRERLDQAQEIYGLLAEKLHSRQELLKSILNSCHDGLVKKDSGDGDVNPRAVARKASSEWKWNDGVMTKQVDEMLSA